MIEKLGKIKKANFGFGGYQNAQVVFEFILGGDQWETSFTLQCGWNFTEEEVKTQKLGWTHEDRIKKLGENAYKVFEYIREAKVKSLAELVGIPVRVFFENEFGPNCGFKILTEVI